MFHALFLNQLIHEKNQKILENNKTINSNETKIPTPTLNETIKIKNETYLQNVQLDTEKPKCFNNNQHENKVDFIDELKQKIKKKICVKYTHKQIV